MPQGNTKTHKETGTKPKTTATPAAWRDTAPNLTAQTTPDHENPFGEHGYCSDMCLVVIH